ELSLAETELKQLRFIHYHVKNLRDIRLEDTYFNETNKHMIRKAVADIAHYMNGSKEFIPSSNEEKLRHLMESYWATKYAHNETKHTKLPTELVLLYELLSIVYLVDEFNERKRD